MRRRRAEKMRRDAVLLMEIGRVLVISASLFFGSRNKLARLNSVVVIDGFWDRNLATLNSKSAAVAPKAFHIANGIPSGPGEVDGAFLIASEMCFLESLPRRRLIFLPYLAMYAICWASVDGVELKIFDQ